MSLSEAVQVDNLGQALVSSGQQYNRYADSSGQKTIKTGPGRACKLINGAASAQTATITIYDNADASTNNPVFAKALGASEVVDLQIPCGSGITLGTSGGAITTAVLLTYA